MSEYDAADDAERDYWQEYKDEQLMGPPREEPDEPELDPLDLDEVERLYNQAMEAADHDADTKLMDEIVPRLIGELRYARVSLDQLREEHARATHVHEYAITEGDEPPTEDTPRVTVERADYVHDHPKAGRAWGRTISTSPWEPHVAPPF
ncbi:hypothetical protein [Microtetraspora glauca]|uniref:Uncharacterized protein n=1 Tax=Microtetraspora glauca TaxID=1996 RepID=A0ABV3GA27_MICGL